MTVKAMHGCDQGLIGNFRQSFSKVWRSILAALVKDRIYPHALPHALPHAYGFNALAAFLALIQGD